MSTPAAVPFNAPLYYQYLFLTLICVFVCWSQTDLLIRCWKCRKLFRSSMALLTNMALCSMCGAYGTLDYSYLMSMVGHKKDGSFMFLINTGIGGLHFARATSTIMLTVDRILVLCLGLQYRQFQTKFICVKIFICFAAFFFFFTVQTVAEWPVDKVTDCDLMLCLLRAGGGSANSVARISLGLIAVITSITFYLILRKRLHIVKTSNTSQFKNINLLVGLSICSEILLVFAPHFVKIASTLAAIPLWQYFGTYTALSSAFDLLAVTIIFRFLLAKQVRGTKVTSVGQISVRGRDF